MRVFHNALDKKEFLVGSGVTLADITLFSHIYIACQTILDAGFRKSVANFDKWFERMAKMPEVRRRLGNVKGCARALKPTLAAKEEKKAAAPKQEAKKEEEKPAAEKKDVNPLDVLPPTKFDLYNFKTFFVNEVDKRGKGMPFFFENYDKDGYSIYFLHYEKYEGEGQVQY